MRFGVPFNGVVPIWHGDAEITWHQPLNKTDLTEVLGLGLVETEPGPAQAPPGWSERVELGFLVADIRQMSQIRCELLFAANNSFFV